LRNYFYCIVVAAVRINYSGRFSRPTQTLGRLDLVAGKSQGASWACQIIHSHLSSVCTGQTNSSCGRESGRRRGITVITLGDRPFTGIRNALKCYYKLPKLERKLTPAQPVPCEVLAPALLSPVCRGRWNEMCIMVACCSCCLRHGNNCPCAVVYGGFFILRRVQGVPHLLRSFAALIKCVYSSRAGRKPT
jgi:hypothetical protein